MTVVESRSSTTVLVTVPVVASCSKLAPEEPVIDTESESVPCTRASSGRSVKVTLPVDWPTGMVMLWPLDSVSTSGEPATAAPTLAA